MQDRLAWRIRSSAAALGLAVVAMFFSRQFVDAAQVLIGVGVGVVVPLGAILASSREDKDLHPLSFRVAAFVLPFGATLGVGSFLARAEMATLFAFFWTATTFVLAWCALGRIARRGFFPIEELSIDVGHLYLPVGGIWLLAARAGYPLLGFHEPVVSFTAAHFHFAGFAAPVLCGLVGRELGLRRRNDAPEQAVAGTTMRGVYTTVAAVVLLGIPLVASGIVVSHALEMPASILLGTGMLGLSGLLFLTGGRRLLKKQLSGLFLVLSGASLIFSMGLVVIFTLTGSATRGASVPWIPYTTMATLHGTANALGFALLGLLGMTLSPPERRVGPFGGRFARLFSDGRVGADFFDREELVSTRRGTVKGQLDRLEDFAHRTFDPSQIHPAVRDFYENTSEYQLSIDPTWHFPFKTGGRIFHWFAWRFLGNLVLPTENEGDREVMTRLFPIRRKIDRRDGVRGYVRAYPSKDGSAPRANYVAAYAIDRSTGTPYLTPAFPLPASSLVARLRLDIGDEAERLILTSFPRKGEGVGSEGMFLVTCLGVLRLPVQETIEVWAEEEKVFARHQARVFGVLAFTLRYSIRKTPSP